MHRRGRPGRRAGMLGRGGRPAPVAEKWQKIPKPRKQRRRRVGYDLRGSTDQVMTALLKKTFVATGQFFFLETAGDGAALTVGVLGTHETSRPYK